MTISDNVENWLSSLLDSTHDTIGSLMHDVMLECGALSVDDCACKVRACMCKYVLDIVSLLQNTLIEHTAVFYLKVLV